MRTRAWLVTIPLLLATATPVVAQGPAGSVHGVVMDESTAVLPGVTVRLVGPDVDLARTTGRDGRFSFTDVPAGTYRLTASMAAFATETREAVIVSVGETELPAIVLKVALNETISVTVTRSEIDPIDSPSALEIMSNPTLTNLAAHNLPDKLRSTTGMNVIQMSARDFNLTSRQNTSTLSSSQLALLDGRSIYLDFFGLILWDMVPTNTADIKQIEVVRGPASAVWGANALSGVVNIITRTPRESQGINLVLGAGLLERGQEDAGHQYNAALSWAAAPSERWSYRVSAGYYRSDAFQRPTGRIAEDTHPLDSRIRTGGGLLPEYPNQGTRQPKLDLRVDQELSGGGRITYAGGIAGTDGIVHSGIAPFDLQSGSYLGYARVAYEKGGFRTAAFMNALRGDAPNLFARDPRGVPIQLDFTTQTYDLEAGYRRTVAGRHRLSVGGNVRRNQFDITIAAGGSNRSEMGAYLQDEILWDRVRLTLGGRLDKFGNLANPVLSPRVALIVKPHPSHALRASFNRAFRSPSLVNNHLDVTINQPVDLSPFARVPGLPPPLVDFFRRPFPLPVRVIGSAVDVPGLSGRDLEPESVTAYEIGYTAQLGTRTTIGIAAYVNDQDDNINLVSNAGTGPLNVPFYTPDAPPPGFPDVTVGPPINPVPVPLGSFVVAALARQAILLPRNTTYLNIGSIRNKGVEVSVEHAFGASWSGFANYSWQADPEPLDDEGDPRRYPTEEIGVPARNRVNAGLTYNGRRLLASASVNWTDEAFWVDVLDRSTHGRTAAFTMLNGTFGLKWAGGRITTAVKGVNLLDQRIQQHVFGDVIRRQLMAELRARF